MKRSGRVTMILLLLALSIAAFGDVRGVVMTREGAPVEGATVSAYLLETGEAAARRWQSSEPLRKPLASATTTKGGAFSLAVEAPVVDLQIEAAGYAPFATQALGDEEIGTCVVRAAERKTGVVSANGKPVARAVVVWIGPTGSELTAVTGEDGRYSMPDPDRWANRVFVHSEAWAVDDETALRTGPKPRLDRNLSRGAVIRGRVVGADGRTPAAGVAIFVDGWRLGVSGDDGTFAIDRAPKSWSLLRAESGETSAMAKKGEGETTLRLAAPRRVTGVVRDGEVAGVIAGAEIVAFALEGELQGAMRSGRPVGGALADANGAFTIELPDGRYELAAVFPGRAIATIEAVVPPSGVGGKTISLTRLARVTGRVVDEEGKPVAAAVVVPARASRALTMGPPGAVMGRGAVSAPDGSFVLRAIEPGDDITLEAGAFGTSAGTTPAMKLRAGETRKGVVVTIPRGVAVSGIVADPSGAPLANVRISPRRMEGGTPRNYFAQLLLGDGAIDDALTGADGRFTMPLPPGDYLLWFSLPGFVAYQTPKLKVEPGLAPLEVTLQQGAAIRGRVVREGKGGIAGAKVELPDHRDASNRSAMTGPDGSFALENLPRGKQRLVVTKDEEWIETTRIVEAPALDLTIEIPRGETVEGRVVDKESGAAITEFSASIGGESGGGALRWAKPVPTKRFSDEEGRFRFEGIAPGNVNVVASAPGYVMKRAAGLTVEEGKPLRDVEIALARGTKIVGRVTDAEGKPLVEVRISPARDMSNIPGVREWNPGEDAATDASGNYEMEAVEPGEKAFRFEKRGFASVNRSVKAEGREVRLDVELSRGLTVEGIVVTEEGEPVEGAQVSVQGGEPLWADGRTNADGRFSIGGIGVKRCEVYASRSGYVSARLEDVDPGTAKALRLVLKRGGRIGGRVIGLEPWEYRLVRVAAFSEAGSASASLDSAGAFVIDAAPTGTVTVFATKSTESVSARMESRREQVELATGGDARVELEFPTGRAIAGRVTRNGVPLAGAGLRFNPRTASVETRGVAVSDDAGRYEVPGLDDGDYNVSVQPDASVGTAHSFSRTIGPGTSTLDFELRSATVRGRVSDPSGRPVEGAHVILEREGKQSGGVFAQRLGESDARGAYVVDDVAPDSWIARAEKEGYASQLREIEVGETGSDGVDFEIAESEGVRLRVVDAASGATLASRFKLLDAAGRTIHDGATLAGTDGTRIPLGAGTYRLELWSEGYAPVARTLSLPSPDVTVALGRGGSLEVRYEGSERRLARLVDPNGADYRLHHWETRSVVPLVPGVHSINNIAPGSYTLVVPASGGGEKGYPVTIREGAISSVTVGR